MSRSISAALMTIVLVMGMSGMASANLITNGSFENAPINSGTWALKTIVPGWTAVSGDTQFEVQNNIGYGVAAAGSQYLELAPNRPETIAQNIVTTIGASYVLRFAYKPRNDAPQNNNWLQAGYGLNGTTIAHQLALLNNPNGTNWNYYSYNFTADATSTAIVFSDYTGNNFNFGRSSYGPFLDDVSVNAVPEPSTLLLLGMGLAGVGLLRRRFKN